MVSELRESVNTSRPDAHDWLRGGGEMGQLIRNFDWSTTQLGPLESWPQSLRSAVSILLPSKAQIAMFWGPDLVTLYNDAYSPVLGKKHPAALGQPGREVWRELWDAGLKTLFEGVLETGEAFWASDHPFYMERFGFPEETFFDISYDPVRDESGKVAGLFCIVSDTTARVISERRLRTLRDLSLFAAAEAKSVDEGCRTVAEILSGNRHDIPFALVYLLDKSGRMAHLMGVSGMTAGAPGAALDIPVSTSLANDSCWRFNLVAETNRSVEITDVIKHCGELSGGVWPEPPHTAMVMPIGGSGQDRTLGFLVVGVSPRRPLDDQYRAFFDLLATQISTTVANARAYEYERKRAESLAELDQAKTAFFSNVSHEFRTPLTLMLGPVSDLLEELEEPEGSRRREQLEIAYRNGLRLQKLVNTLLDFSRIEAGRVEASYEATNLSSLTAELASNFRSACEKAGIDLIVDCPGLGEVAFVDPDMWEKIVLNLLSNAFKFTLSGKIEVRLRKSSNEIELSVRDTGVGIPTEALPKIFERFHRVRLSQGRTQEGSGIGLALVRELVKLHGGSVRVASEPGKGSLFTVSIPRGKDHLPKERLNRHRTLTSTSLGAAPFVSEALRWLPQSTALAAPVPSRAAQSGLSRRFRILLADDNADMRDYVSRLLDDRYEVLAVPDGQAAWEAIEQDPPDLVLTDLMMPVVDGFQLIERIRANPQTAGLPVVLLSARAGEEARIEGLEASADDYLVKPFSTRELLATVDAQVKTLRMRRQSQDALRVSEARYRQIFEQSIDGVFVATAEGRYVDVSPSGCEMFGMTREEILNRTFTDLLVAEEHSRIPAAIAEFVDGKVHHTEWKFQRKDGSIFVGEVAGRALPDGRLQGIVRDITAQKQAHAERLHLIEQLRDQDRRKDQFLATLAHELRNPLAPIRNGLHLIRHAGSNAATKEHATMMMQRQIEQMIRLVEDLLDVARISRNKLDLRKERTDVESIVRTAVETSRPVLEEGDHHLDLILPPTPLTLSADSVRLSQVFSNLLTNAARYSQPGSRISFEAREEGGELIVCVKDEGIGISADKLSKIFEMFVQLDGTDGQRRTGLGVGLTLVKTLVEMHGGKVEARSDGHGHGSEFIVRLPIVQASIGESVSASTSTATQTAPRRVLVVDDNVDSAESMAMILKLSGHEVALAHDGEQALQVARAFQPDVAFLDLGMPNVNGYEAARLIRKESWGERIMLVALTGWGQEEDKRRTLDAGFDLHVVKPIDFAKLDSLVSQSNQLISPNVEELSVSGDAVSAGSE